ncbi:hypothetical protein B0H16DRAFT_1591032 [Mycena metata]|uniref:Uncharacterized protein n=1 Tax=Mycena metata TaxID=1033252 RepID=A0AAD7HSD6_9AGAR|nr:hypothetical protein B0H16DRAFT_1591032 [Mycena metata]
MATPTIPDLTRYVNASKGPAADILRHNHRASFLFSSVVWFCAPSASSLRVALPAQVKWLTNPQAAPFQLEHRQAYYSSRRLLPSIPQVKDCTLVRPQGLQIPPPQDSKYSKSSIVFFYLGSTSRLSKHPEFYLPVYQTSNKLSPTTRAGPRSRPRMREYPQILTAPRVHIPQCIVRGITLRPPLLFLQLCTNDCNASDE